ncbi:MAG: TolC family protein [Gammaproteobacteria bacterium]|nr:TolC family protein [Gammaproteobacteria bacterium]
MSFRAILFSVLITLAASFSHNLLAEIVTPERSDAVTLTTVTDKVYQRNPAQHMDTAIQQQVNANTDRANTLFADVSTVNLRHQNDVVGTSNGLQEWEANLEMPLWLPGQKQQQLALSDTMLAEIAAYKQALRLQASGKVRELIWNVALAETATKQAWQAWQTAQQLESDVKTRVTAGELANTELLLANTNVLEIRSKYLQLAAELEHAISSYTHITGQQFLPGNYEESLPELAFKHHAEIVVNQQHPALMILDQQITTLRAKQELAKFDGAVNPSVSVGIKRERGDLADGYDNSVGLGITFALDDKVYRQPAVAEAARALADAEIARKQLERQLNITLFSALHDLETKRQLLELIAQKDAATQKYVALQQRSFELGETDLVSLLRSQELANESHSRKQALEIDIKHMIASVNQAMGMLL